MNQTVIGTFDSTTDADDAVRDLVDAGISQAAVQLHSQETGTTPPEDGTTHVSGDHNHTVHASFFERVERFFSHLVGENDRPAEFSHYHEAIRRGGALVSVDVENDNEFEIVKRVLNDAGAVDIDERAAQWQSSGYIPGGAGASDQATVSTTSGHLGEHTQGASQNMAPGRNLGAGQSEASNGSSTGGRAMGSMGAMSTTAGLDTTSDRPATDLNPMLERDAPSTLQAGTGSSLGLGADMGSTSGMGATAGMGSTSGMGTVSTTGASTPAGLTSGVGSASGSSIGTTGLGTDMGSARVDGGTGVGDRAAPAQNERARDDAFPADRQAPSAGSASSKPGTYRVYPRGQGLPGR